MNFLDLLQNGILGLSGWTKVLVTVVMLQVSLMAKVGKEQRGFMDLTASVVFVFSSPWSSSRWT